MDTAAKSEATQDGGPKRMIAVVALVFVCVGAFYLLPALGYVFHVTGEARERETLLKMQKIEQAYQNYFALNGNWPASPDVLIESTPNGPPPLLEGGPSAIQTAWGTPFTVEFRLDGENRQNVVVTALDQSGQHVLRWPTP